MPQLSPLMWVFSFIMILFFLLGLILLESNYINNSKVSRVMLMKNFINLKW